jgi:hypothetical protein
MRYATALLVLSSLLLSRPGLAQEDAGTRLFGSWRLISLKMHIVGEDAPPRDSFGPHPFGRLILTPEHYMAAYLSRPNRKPPTNEAEAAALMGSMVAYTGKFRLEGDKFITTVDGAWSEVFKANEQVRYFTLEGDKLSIRTPEQPSGTMPGKRISSELLWEREK